VSYGLMVYAIDIDRLQSVCGGGDLDLYAAIIDKFRSEIANLNDSLGLDVYHQSDPSLFEGIRHLITGAPKNFDGAIYGYGLEFIVRYFGTFLNNSLFYPCDLNLLSEVVGDRLNGIVSIDRLIFSRPIAKLPSPDDFPIYGHLTNAEVTAATQRLATVRAEYADREWDELAFVIEWLQYAADRHLGLVGYYY
jgi:hypothetical protein